ncbi:MAG: DUF971 domain-containing protein [Chthoniobacterales bacterium]
MSSSLQPPASSLPKALAVGNDELAIAWQDGEEQYLLLEALRRACPCALCAGEPDVMGQTPALGKKTYTPESFILKKYEFVGGYALQFFWGDGHSSGIYSFQYLRKTQRHFIPPPPDMPVKELEAIHKKIVAAAAEIHPDDWR